MLIRFLLGAFVVVFEFCLRPVGGRSKHYSPNNIRSFPLIFATKFSGHFFSRTSRKIRKKLNDEISFHPGFSSDMGKNLKKGLHDFSIFSFNFFSEGK